MDDYIPSCDVTDPVYIRWVIAEQVDILSQSLGEIDYELIVMQIRENLLRLKKLETT